MPMPVKILGSPRRKRIPAVRISRTYDETFLIFVRRTLRAMEESLISLVPWGKTSTSPVSMSLTREPRASKGGSRDCRTMLSTDRFSSMRSNMCMSTASRRYSFTISSVRGMMVTGQ